MWLSLCAFGLAQGMRHALEPDHLAAVSVVASDAGSSWRTVRYAAAWGLGHASMLFLVGGALWLARASMPAAVSTGLEVVVALMLVVLGARGLVQAARIGRTRHAGHAHAEFAHVHVAGRPLALMPFAVGLVHGLAGSGALAALVMAAQPELAHGALLLAVYAFGTALGMTLLAGALGAPLQRLARRPRGRRLMVASAALVSLGVGLWWGASVLA